MTIGHQLGLRLFLEGIEVPVISAQINIVADSPAAASIQIIATDKATEILPRTMVHLFFYDFVNATSAIESEKQELIAELGIKTEKELEQQNYKLLFMGEVQGLQFQKDPYTRNMILSCVDFSNYWDTTYQYNFQGSLIGGRRQAAFIGANANYFTGPLGHGHRTISRLLRSKSVNFPKLQGLLGGIIRVLEAIGGAYYGRNTFRGANDFTAIAELRCKLLQQICAAEEDTSTSRLFDRKTFAMWMNRECGSLGKLVTFRGLCQLMQGYIYHETYPNPAAKYEPAVKDIPMTGTAYRKLADDSRASMFVAGIRNIRRLNSGAQSALVKIRDNGVLDEYAKTLTANIDSMFKIVRELKITVPTIPGLDLLADVNKIDTSLNDIKKNIGLPSGSFVLDRRSVANVAASKTVNTYMRDIETVVASILAKGSTHAYNTTYDKLERVNNQIFRPDVWYAPAPRCNVLFPELYSGVGWSRNFLREISRVELQTTNEILKSDAIFNGRYYAPNVEDMRKGLKLASRKFFGLVMQHELLTGIIPMYEKMTQVNLYSMKSAGIKGQAAKVSYAQRAVNHQYFKHRFSTRQMQVTGRFNPWFVAGFPGVVIDRPMNSENLVTAAGTLDQMNKWWREKHKYSGEDKLTRAEIMRELVGPQYVGSCVQLDHSVTQQGGSTNYVFGQARLHRESVEYLGVDKVKISERVGSTSRKYRVTVHPNRLPTVGSKGVYGGKITSAVNITEASKGQIFTIWPDMKDYQEVGVSLSITATPAASSTDIWKAPTPPDPNRYVGTNFFGDPLPRPVGPQQLDTTIWWAYEVVEAADIRRTRISDLPIEDAIRPPWIWDGWHNIKIGDTYRQFFGTNSIVDTEGIVSAAQIQSIEQEAQQALWETKRGLETGSGRGFNKNSFGYEADPPVVRSTKKMRRNTFLSSSTDHFSKPRKNVPAPAPVGISPVNDQADKELSSSSAYVIDKSKTIEASVDTLTRVYSIVRDSGLDVGLFIRNYTWRPIATMPEILGTQDLMYDEDKKTGKLTVRSGKEGFHSRAYGNVENLFGLVNPKVRRVLGLSPDKDHATAVRLDVRKKRWQVISAYYEELMSSRGLLG